MEALTLALMVAIHGTAPIDFRMVPPLWGGKAPVCPQGLRPEEPLFSVQELRPADPADWPALADDLALAGAPEAARRTALYWARQPAGRAVKVGPRRVTAAALAAGYEELARLLETGGDVRSRFELLEAVTSGGGRQGTITAYYDPELKVSETPLPEHVPVHAKPANPDFTRAQITQGALDGQGLELFWTRHATDLNVAQTQGSAWAVLPDGRRLRLSFDGTNGKPFRSVGQALIDCGLIPAGTPPFELLRRLRAQPFDRERSWVDLNPRYVFFKALAGGGPWGALGVELVAGRSIAVDPAHVPLGLAGFLVTRKPVVDLDGNVSGDAPVARFIFTHDVGSAIRGPVRVDLFWGAGAQAAAEAHHMKAPGRLFVFLPR